MTHGLPPVFLYVADIFVQTKQYQFPSSFVNTQQILVEVASIKKIQHQRGLNEKPMDTSFICHTLYQPIKMGFHQIFTVNLYSIH